MSAILLTGGAGYIGSHTCLKLLENRFDVFVLDSFVMSDPSTLEIIKKYFKKKFPDFNNNLYYFRADIRDYSSINKVFSEAKKLDKAIKAVIHFAGLKSVNSSISNPLIYWDNNFSGTISLIKSMEKNNCRTLVFSSSATIYEPEGNEIIKEDTRINPNNPYGKTKAAVESLLNDIYNSNPEKWRIANLRYFNPVGSHPSGIIGEENNKDLTNLFPKILEVANGFKDKLSIYGNDWETKDGTCIRDYIHVMDLAEGHIRTLNYLTLKQNKFINLNLGTGEGKSVLEVIETFEKVNKIKIPYIFEKRRRGDRAEVVANIKFSKNILNWQSTFKLTEMCRDSWNWANKNKKN